jgi:general secretion pathway protein D
MGFVSTRIVSVTLCVGLAIGLGACGARPFLDGSHAPDRLTLRHGTRPNPSLGRSTPHQALVEESHGTVQPGTDLLVQETLPDLAGKLAGDEERGTLNLVKVPLAEAARSILGDILGLNYSIDGRVEAEITLQITEPVTKTELVANFQSILRAQGAVIVEQSGFYRIIPASDAAKANLGLSDGRTSHLPGVRTEIIALRYVSAEAIRQIIEPLAADGAVRLSDPTRNALVVSGTADELQNIRESIAVFDVDWMKGMSFALFPVKTSAPQAIAAELDTIFATRQGPLKDVVRFVPNARLKSILVITSRARYLKEAAAWISRLDHAAGKSETTLHVYHVQNRLASELAAVLQPLYGQKGSSDIGRQVAPKLDAVQVTVQNPEEGETDPAPISPAPEEPGGGGHAPRIVADDANNALLIIATPDEYDRILEILLEIDSIPNQVMLEATIAEVSLSDELSFGMRWYFGDKSNRGTFTDVLTGSVVSSFPGFSYFFNGVADVGVVLNALSSLTKVNILSSPTLMVLDNRTATLQVGDQVPIVTQTANSVTSSDAPLVSSVEMKDTGVILTVTPRVNDSGRVTLDIKQEVSDVVATTTSGIDSPTIRQRKVATTVTVNDGDTLALGGLIQEHSSTAKTKTPLLADIPFLGTAFRSKSNSADRTELVIFIRPRVTRDVTEARRITREFRDEMSLASPRSKSDRTQMQRDLRRIME